MYQEIRESDSQRTSQVDGTARSNPGCFFLILRHTKVLSLEAVSADTVTLALQALWVTDDLQGLQSIQTVCRAATARTGTPRDISLRVVLLEIRRMLWI